MKDSIAIIVFKVFGVVHFLAGFFNLLNPFYIVGFLVLFDRNLLPSFPTSAVLIQYYLLPTVLILFYFISTFGFLKMKKWQPILFTITVVLLVARNVFINVLSGIEVTDFLSIGMLFVYTAVLIVLLLLVWSKKALFNN